eukprot:scaffold172069_cov26-Tisochrysis_lutea.AAC.1
MGSLLHSPARDGRRSSRRKGFGLGPSTNTAMLRLGFSGLSAVGGLELTHPAQRLEGGRRASSAQDEEHRHGVGGRGCVSGTQDRRVHSTLGARAFLDDRHGIVLLGRYG